MHLDMSKFKKVAGDRHKTTLRHEDGHQITIEHKALSPKMREQFMALGVEDVPRKNAKAEKPEESKKSPETMPAPKAHRPQAGVARREAPVKMAEGGEAGGDQAYVDPQSQTYSPTLAANYAQEAAIQATGPQPGPGPVPMASEDTAAAPQQGASGVEAGTPPPASMPQAAPEGSQVANPGSPEDIATRGVASGKAGGGQEPSLMAGFNLGMSAADQMGHVAGEIAKKQADIQQEHAKSTAQLHSEFQQAHQEKYGEIQAAVNDIKADHIKPNQYLDNMSTGGKIKTAIGLILGGIGSGLTKQPSAALDFIKSQIDRDVQAQVSNLNKKQNLVGMYFKQIGDMRDATTMARSVLAEKYATEMEQVALQSGDKMAQLRAQEAKANLHKAFAPEYYNMLWRQAAMKMMSGEGMTAGKMDQTLGLLRAVQPEAAKEIESRYVPSVGLSSVPIESKQRDEIVARKSLSDQVTALRQWSAKHAGSMNPADWAYGSALARSVQDAYRRANGQGVFREAEAKFVQGIVADDPTAFFNKFRVDPKYRALNDANDRELQGLYKGYGIKPLAGQAQQSGVQSGGFVPKSFRPGR